MGTRGYTPQTLCYTLLRVFPGVLGKKNWHFAGQRDLSRAKTMALYQGNASAVPIAGREMAALAAEMCRG
jgi:hypothetical protein